MELAWQGGIGTRGEPLGQDWDDLVGQRARDADCLGVHADILGDIQKLSNELEELVGLLTAWFQVLEKPRGVERCSGNRATRWRTHTVKCRVQRRGRDLRGRLTQWGEV